MNWDSPDLLYDLLPEEYRNRDAREGYPLRALLGIISSQVQLVKEDIDRLYDNLFVETAQPWVVPYIGDLIGSSPLAEATGRARADVAKSTGWRRRKGTPAMLEELAADVTGWQARAVDLFEQAAWTQNVNHLRPGAVRTPDLRKPAISQLGRAFDSAPGLVDLKPVCRGEGRNSLAGVAFYLWRLGAYPITGATPAPAAEGDTERYSFSPLGLTAPLFHLPRAGGHRQATVSELAVPGPLRPSTFTAHTDVLYGPDRSLLIIKDGVPVPLAQIWPACLSDWAADPPAGKVAVDVVRGRFRFAPGEGSANVQVCYVAGFSRDMGGGPYIRPDHPLETIPAGRTVQGGGEALSAAVTEWVQSQERDGVIEILDSATYTGRIAVVPQPGGRLIIRAAQGQRPVIRPGGASQNISIGGNEPEAAVHLIGLCIDGGIYVAEGLGQLTVRHCTLVPRLRPPSQPDGPETPAVSIQAVSTETASLRLAIEHSITGPLKLSDKLMGLTISDSIVDGLGGQAIGGPSGIAYGPRTAMAYATVLGPVQLREVEEATGVLFNGKVAVQRRNAGTVRYSFIPPGSDTPRRYRCQPEMAVEGLTFAAQREPVLARLVPVFTSLRYGDPAYCQLSRSCPAELRTGAEDGAEMGAFHALMQPQRERNLRTRLQEYLPVGREAGLIYVT